MNDASTTPKDSQTQLAQDFKAVVNDAEELLRHAAHDAGQGYHDARERLEQSLRTARRELDSMEQALLEGARHAGRATDDYVHGHPWESIGIGTGVGLLVGMLIARR